jgi:CRP-like cAMP-binding protein
MISTIEKVIFLQNVDVFAKVPTEQLTFLAAIAEEVSALKDDEIYKRDDPSQALYIVLDGTVSLHRDGREITQAQMGDAFGTWSLFDDEPYVATATVVDDARLLRIEHDDFYEVLADNVEVTRGVIRTVATRLRGLIHRVGVDQSGADPTGG